MHAHLVKPGADVKLADINPSDHGGLSEDEALVRLAEIGEQNSGLQELLFAAKTHSLLIVLQGIDTSGKDGAIRRILHSSNVQSTRVSPFKVPSPVEAAHDFLWRVHAATPGRGEVTIFNRSHYEDVLTVRVHKLVPKKEWKKRFDQINAFEELLVSANTIVLKFYLHISKDEQEKRLLDREKNPDTAWKLSVSDWRERLLWDDLIDAYEDALSKCSTKPAPWRIVPANHKWFRDLAIAEAIHDSLKPHKDEWQEALKELGEKEKAAIAAFRAQGADAAT